MFANSEPTRRRAAIPEGARPMTAAGAGGNSVDGRAAAWLSRQKIAIPDRMAGYFDRAGLVNRAMPTRRRLTVLTAPGASAPVITRRRDHLHGNDRTEQMFDATTRQAHDLHIVVFSCRRKVFRDRAGHGLHILRAKGAQYRQAARS